MTNFIKHWKTPEKKAPPRKYLSDAGSPLALCSYLRAGHWTLTFADGSTRITTIRPTPAMAAIHNANVAKLARENGATSSPRPAEPPKHWH